MLLYLRWLVTRLSLANERHMFVKKVLYLLEVLCSIAALPLPMIVSDLNHVGTAVKLSQLSFSVKRAGEAAHGDTGDKREATGTTGSNKSAGISWRQPKPPPAPARNVPREAGV